MQPCVGRKRHRQISDDAVASDEDDSGEDASCKDGPDDTFQRSAFLDMCVLQLVEGPGIATGESHSAYQKNGADTTRIRKAHKCGCKDKCMEKIRLQELTAFCCKLHSLPQESINHVIYTAYHTDALGDNDGKRPRTHWHLLGHRVHVSCLQKALGIHIYKKCHGKLDMRKCPKPASARTKSQSMIVQQFFCETYWSAAERLPEKEGIQNADQEFSVAEAMPSSVQCPGQADVEESLSWTPNTSAMDIVGPSVMRVQLSKRYLQSGRLSDLWWQFLAWWAACSEALGGAASKHPSYPTFWRVWNEHWRHMIGFRWPSEHSQCSICFRYSAFLVSGTASLKDKLNAAKEWQEHLRGQYHDRLIYWHMRWFSRLRTKLVLCIIIDGMDKAKFAWPRYNFRQPKCLDRLRRPRLSVTCAWAHGFCCDFYVADDETTHHGAACYCEIVLRTIQRVMDICRQKNLQPPEHLVLQSDNTTAWAKNSLAGQFLATLVGRNKFATALLCFLIVGHTHEDIDQLFSVLLSSVLKRFVFQTPAELIEYMRIAMEAHFAGKDESVSVIWHDHIHDFKAWLDDAGVELHNAFVSRLGIDAPHSFQYKLRMDLSAFERRQVKPRRGAGQDDDADVFCLTKRWMHSVEHNGPPVLVLPKNRLDRVGSGPERTFHRADAMSAQRKQEIKDLASGIANMTEDWGTGFSYFRAAAALRALVDDDVVHPFCHTWLHSQPGAHAPVATTENRYFNNLPGMAWNLIATFRRI